MSTALPATMTAIEIAEPGGPEVLRPVQCPVPAPREDDVLIRVRAAGVNRPDVLQRKGIYPPPEGASPLPGLEVAGEIARLGAAASGFAAGDMVTALLAGGGYAEYAVAPAKQCLPVPRGLSFTEAASLPETFFTVWSNLFDRARLRAEETVRVHGGTSGIGIAAIQLAAAFGARVLATAGSAEKCAACLRLGASRAINYKEEDFVAATREATDGRGADVILDMVGGDYVARNIKACAADGRIVQIAFLGGARVTLDLMALMRNRITLTGSTLRPRETAFKAAIAAALRQKVWPLIEQGRIRPVIDSVFPLADAAKAHARMESSLHIGKIVLET
ncbi:MAG: zinc-binding dehydrogenase [Alphaproteobacteria bacterium]|nr:zinc-binding dehydrogenase [Alphaproteobacteria bacterium]